jgi:hypothetical protein
VATQARDDRSLGQLFAELAQEMGTLVRQEMALATTEIGHKASSVGRQLGFLALGGAVAYAGLLAIVAAAVLLLAQVVPLWLSALLIGLLVAGIGYVLVQASLAALRNIDLTPRQTVRSLKEDVQWAREQTR